jgi:phage protein D
VRLTCFALPKIRPGQVIEIQDLPDRFPDRAWYVTEVRHRVAGARATTRIAARAADAGGGAGGLLAQAAAALGGLA